MRKGRHFGRSVWALGILAAVAFGGCGGGGGGGGGSSSSGGGGGGGGAGGAVTGLEVASKVTVVDAKNASGSRKVAARTANRTAAVVSVPAGSDYATDPTRTYVHERAGEVFNSVNDILCMIAQTKYADMVNKGAYVALVDQKLCENSAGGGSSQAGTSASNAPNYMTWTVVSTRTDDSSPEVLKAWIHQPASDQEDSEKFIFARSTITEAASDTNPIGIFRTNFAGYPAAGGVKTSDTPVFQGSLWSERDPVTSKVQIKFVQSEGQRSARAVLEKNPDGTGRGSAFEADSSNGGPPVPAQFDFAYSSSLFHRVGGIVGGQSSDVCLDRNEFEVSTWRYGLYDSLTGDRAEIEGGFPFNTRADGQGAHGWIGYYGLWVPDGVHLGDGDTIYRQAGSSTTPYAVVVKEGKLKKFTRHETTLSEIANVPMEGRIGASWPTIYRVEWDGQHLVKTASAQQNPSGPPAWEQIPGGEILDAGNLMSGDLSLWSSGLGGQVHIQLSGCAWVPGEGGSLGHTACSAPTGATPVAYYTEAVVYPGDTVPDALACYDNCPKAGPSGIDPADLSYAGWATRHDYTFDETAYLLSDGANPVVLDTTAASQPWGVSSGALFDPTADNLDKLKCDYNQQETCGWKVWSALDTFYTWETGPNTWNRFTGAKIPGGAPVQFEAPWRVAYTHSQADPAAPDRKYDGVTFQLDYAGFGQLQGIPGKCVDETTGETLASCNGGNSRWVPEFSIAAGSSVTRAAAGSTQTLLVKPLEQEQRMSAVASGACAAIPVSGFTLPDIAAWEDPALGSEPSVTAPPAVIGGVVQ